MSDDLDDVDQMLTRRGAIAATAGLLAGCTSGDDQQGQPPSQNNSSQPNGSDPANGSEPANETDESDGGNEELDAVTFDQVYRNSVDKVENEDLQEPLTTRGLERGFRADTLEQFKAANQELSLVRYSNSERGYKRASRHFRGAFTRQFEVGQRRVWQQDDLTLGSAMAIDTYRVGVDRGETFEEYVIQNDNPGTWLSASRALDGQNDFVVFEPEYKERAEWGEIGYSRSASNMIRDFMDLFENQDFTPEWEMEEELTEMYHNRDVVGNPDNFIHVGVTESGVEDDQRLLTEVDGKKLYAEICDFKQHKKDAYEIAIPEQHWEEGHRYPGDVEIPDSEPAASLTGRELNSAFPNQY